MEPEAVVLFRAAKQPEDSYDLVLREAGYVPHFIPVLQFHYTNQESLQDSLLDPTRYSGLVITSQTAVEAVCAALTGSPEVTRQPQLVERWKECPVFVVGKATAETVAKLGLKAFGSCSGNAEALSQVIIKHFASHPQRGPLLFPCSNLRRETLPTALREAGLTLEALISYNTEPHANIQKSIKCFIGELAPGVGVCAVFFSPSGVSNALEKFTETWKNRASLKLIAIGPTTAEALTKSGHPPSAVATKPTPESLLEAISLA